MAVEPVFATWSLHARLSAATSIRYPVTAAPPLFGGEFHDTSSCVWLFPVTVNSVGAPGAVTFGVPFWNCARPSIVMVAIPPVAS